MRIYQCAQESRWVQSLQKKRKRRLRSVLLVCWMACWEPVDSSQRSKNSFFLDWYLASLRMRPLSTLRIKGRLRPVVEPYSLFINDVISLLCNVLIAKNKTKKPPDVSLSLWLSLYSTSHILVEYCGKDGCIKAVWSHKLTEKYTSELLYSPTFISCSTNLQESLYYSNGPSRASS